jgi:3-methylcrotonyl-CoA carboxylase alpha subunit
MFKKILIANRGEIACRVMATAKRLGIRTVAVYSDADAGAKHVAMADEAYRIGPAPVGESYLQYRQDHRGLPAKRRRGGPSGLRLPVGKPRLRRRARCAGIAFIGPSADAIRAMGLKDAAKALMEKAGVPVVPGYHRETQDPGSCRSRPARSAIRS